MQVRFSKPVKFALSKQWLRQLAYLALPMIYLVGMYSFYPYRDQFQLDLDEGGEAMKALLVARGYPLYYQVWSDQPPVLTYFLAGCLRIFGPDLNAGRNLILIFSSILIAAAVHFLHTNWGDWHALAGAVLIFLLPFYNTLSVSLMFGLPAISFAMLSMAALSAWHQHRRISLLVLSAITLVLSVQTKLFTFFLAPIFTIGLFLEEWSIQGRLMKNWRSVLHPAIIWSVWFSGVLLAITLIAVGPANIGELIFTHLEASQLSTYISQANAQPIFVHLRDAWPILSLACVGLVWIVLERRWTSLYLIAWIASAYTLLNFHAPVWFHHQLLVSIPAAMVAAIAGGEAVRMFIHLIRSHTIHRGQAMLVALSLAGLILAIVVRTPLVLSNLYRAPVLVANPPHSPWAEQMFLTRMSNHAPKTHWVVTDLPMYAFRVGMIVPPNLSFITEKSLATGEITEEQIIQTIEQYRPELVLLGRRQYPEIKQYLQANYRLLYERGKRQLYLRKDLKGQSWANQPK